MLVSPPPINDPVPAGQMQFKLPPTIVEQTPAAVFNLPPPINELFPQALLF